MDSNDRFATKVSRIDEAPRSFRDELLRAVAGEPLRMLVFGPAFASLGVRSPATLLGLTDHRWILVSDDEDGGVHVVECAFSDTLLVEVTAILLYGRLKIDFATRDQLHACAIEFNMVDEEVYREATESLLEGIEGATGHPAESESAWSEASDRLKSWPLKFYDAMSDYLPTGHRLQAATCWPAVVGGFRKELAPAAAVAITDRELLLISEERAAPWIALELSMRSWVASSHIFRRVRLAKFFLDCHDHFTVLELDMYASHGGERLKIVLPSDRAHAVATLMAETRADNNLVPRLPRTWKV